jgi:hypothetical protein
MSQYLHFWLTILVPAPGVGTTLLEAHYVAEIDIMRSFGDYSPPPCLYSSAFLSRISFEPAWRKKPPRAL